MTADSEILTDIMDEGCPPLYGYVAATPKTAANVILQSEEGDPILTTWQYGLGRTIAWNSDADNEWTGQFAAWEQYPLLWSNLIQYVIADTQLGNDSFELNKEGNQVTVTYETPEYDTDTEVHAVITKEAGQSQEVLLEAVKPGTYETVIDAGEVGVYSISMRKQTGDIITKVYNTAYANQYSQEYQFSDHAAAFENFVMQAGGKMLTLKDSVWTDQLSNVRKKVSLTIPILIIAMFFFLFDIIIRRWSIDIAALFRKGIGKIGGEVQKQGSKVRDRFGKKKVQRKRKQEKVTPHVKITVKPMEQKKESLDLEQLLQKKREREQ